MSNHEGVEEVSRRTPYVWDDRKQKKNLVGKDPELSRHCTTMKDWINWNLKNMETLY